MKGNACKKEGSKPNHQSLSIILSPVAVLPMMGRLRCAGATRLNAFSVAFRWQLRRLGGGAAGAAGEAGEAGGGLDDNGNGSGQGRGRSGGSSSSGAHGGFERRRKKRDRKNVGSNPSSFSAMFESASAFKVPSPSIAEQGSMSTGQELTLGNSNPNPFITDEDGDGQIDEGDGDGNEQTEVRGGHHPIPSHVVAVAVVVVGVVIVALATALSSVCVWKRRRDAVRGMPLILLALGSVGLDCS